MSRLAVIALTALVAATSARAESFYLKSEQPEASFGPFPYEDGAVVTIGDAEFTLERSASVGSATSPAIWREDPSDADIPEIPVGGMACGVPFAADRVRVSGGILQLRQGSPSSGYREFKVFLFLRGGADIEGKRFYMTPDHNTGPHIHLLCQGEKGSLPETRTYTKRYSLILEFGRRAEGRVPGRIYLCLPDEERSFVAGRFEVEDRG